MMMRRTVVSALTTLLAAASLTLSAYAQSSTAFTYQGFLKDNGQPANGTYDLKFTLYDAATEGDAIGNPVYIEDLQIQNGLFTVEIDFGVSPFAQGQRRWLEIGIRSDDSDYETLPRIELTPVPYALYAQNVANNAVSANQLANDPNALSKVSGGNLSITEGGYLLKSKQVFFDARRFKYAQESLINLFARGQSTGWYVKPIFPRSTSEEFAKPYAIQFDENYITATGPDLYESNSAGPATDDSAGTQFIAPVDGYYYVSVRAHIISGGGDAYWWGFLGLDHKTQGDQWKIVSSSYSANNPQEGRCGMDTLSLSTILYLKSGDRLRLLTELNGGEAGGHNNQLSFTGHFAWGQNIDGLGWGNNFTIYLLSAADAPSN